MEFMQGESLRTYKLQTFDEIIEVARQVYRAHSMPTSQLPSRPQTGKCDADQDESVKLTTLAWRSVVRASPPVALCRHDLLPASSRPKPIDGRTGLWGSLYELTGRLPFDADNPLAIISQHLHAPVVPPSTFRADLPPELERIILRLLAKDPNDRFATAGEMILRLDEMNGAHLAQPGPLVVSETPDAIVLLEKLARGRLIGRHNDVAQLRETWKAAQQGRSRLVLISGEPGVGKTRLAHELAVYAGLGALSCAAVMKERPHLPAVDQALRIAAEQNPGCVVRAWPGLKPALGARDRDRWRVNQTFLPTGVCACTIT
jgi:hypothetical protein